MTDREVAFVLPRCHSNPYDMPVLASPSWPQGFNVGIIGFQIHCHFFVARKIGILRWNVPIIVDQIQLVFNLVMQRTAK